MYAMTKMKKNKNKSVCLISSLCNGFIAIMFLVFSIFLIGWWNSLVVIFIFFVLLVLFMVMLIWSVVHFVVGLLKKRSVIFFMLPLVVNITVILLVIFVPFGKYGYTLWYLKNLDDYNEVVDMIEVGELYGAEKFWILPEEYSYLSDRGEIVMKESQEGFCVMFYTLRGLGITGSNGFVYCTEGAPLDIGYTIETKTKKSDNWYWVSTY